MVASGSRLSTVERYWVLGIRYRVLAHSAPPFEDEDEEEDEDD
jgi:hypothetical protein